MTSGNNAADTIAYAASLSCSTPGSSRRNLVQASDTEVTSTSNAESAAIKTTRANRTRLKVESASESVERIIDKSSVPISTTATAVRSTPCISEASTRY